MSRFMERKNEPVDDRLSMIENDLDNIDEDMARLTQAFAELTLRFKTFTTAAWALCASVFASLVGAVISRLGG